MRLAVFALASPTFDVTLAAVTAAAAVTSLRLAGAALAGDATLLMDADGFEARLAELRDRPVDGVVVLQASFCDAGMIERLALSFDVPIAVWAFPEARTGGPLRLNSFCGLNLAAHALGRLGRRCPYRYAPPETTPDLADLFTPPPEPTPRAVRADGGHRARAALAGVYGLVGEHAPGSDTCAFDAEVLRARFGAEVAPLGLATLFADARAQTPARVARLRAETAVVLAGLDELEPEAVDRALRAYAALADAVAAGGLKGVAVGCWSETFDDYGCALCGAMARLGEEATPASCEADMLGTLTTRLLQELGDAPALLCDIVDMDAASDTSVVWHCGLAPLSMRDPASPAEATVHPNRRQPLLNQFALKPGRVTLARLSRAKDGLALAVASGEMIRAPLPFAGTGGTLRLDGGTARIRDRLLGAGLEHHLSIVHGELKADLVAAAGELELPLLDLDAAP